MKPHTKAKEVDILNVQPGKTLSNLQQEPPEVIDLKEFIASIDVQLSSDIAEKNNGSASVATINQVAANQSKG